MPAGTLTTIERTCRCSMSGTAGVRARRRRKTAVGHRRVRAGSDRRATIPVLSFGTALTVGVEERCIRREARSTLEVGDVAGVKVAAGAA